MRSSMTELYQQHQTTRRSQRRLRHAPREHDEGRRVPEIQGSYGAAFERLRLPFG